MPQGTVKTFDIESRSGVVVLDDQTEIPYDTQTFLASGLEELRLGQRVRFEIDGAGEDRRIRELQLASF